MIHFFCVSLHNAKATGRPRSTSRPALPVNDVLQFHVAQLRLALGNQVADDQVALATLARPTPASPESSAAPRGFSDSATATGTSASPSSLASVVAIGSSGTWDARTVSGTSVGSSTASDAAARRGARGAEQEGQERQCR